MLIHQQKIIHLLLITSSLMPAIADANTQKKDSDSHLQLNVGITGHLEEYITKTDDDQGAISLFFEYEGDRLTVKEEQAYYRIANTDQLSLSLLIENNHSGYDDSSLTIFKDMEDRDLDLGLGLRLAWSLGDGNIISSISNDIAGAHDSYVAKLAYEHPFYIGRWAFEPEVGSMHYSKDYVDYYYGVRNQEVTSTRAAYEGDAATAYYTRLKVRYQATPNWQIFSEIGSRRFSDEIKDSPLTENKNNNGFALLGVGYIF